MRRTICKLIAVCFLFLPMTDHAQSGAANLKLHLGTDATSVALDGKLKVTISLLNDGVHPLTVYGELLRGYAGGIVLHVKDASGKDVPPKSLDDDLVPPPSPRSQGNGRFLTLFPGHFWGRTEEVMVSELVDKPGTYHLTISYQSPLPRSLGHGQFFWGRENPPVMSNEVVFRVQ